ncbi:MAG: hypothetical protein EOS23_24970 [Mesorhizobium sp.]|nr:MAG: hypothetical protein EOS23_24970 [Mesorhizobium sp.]
MACGSGDRTQVGASAGSVHFWPDRKAEQREIDQYFANGLEYVGDWHTHPGKVPTPSRDDIYSIDNVLRESTLYTSGDTGSAAS